MGPIYSAVLSDLGILDHLLQNRHLSCLKSLQICDYESPSSLHFNSENTYIGGPIAYITDYSRLDQELDEKIKELSDITVLSEGIKAIDFMGKDSVLTSTPPSCFFQKCIHLENGDKLLTKLIIAADGHNSSVRKLSNMDAFGWKSENQLLLFKVKSGEIQNAFKPSSTGWIKFLPFGPISVFPIMDSCYSIVWNSTIPHVEHLMTLPPEAFIKDLNGALGFTAHSPPSPPNNVPSDIFSTISNVLCKNFYSSIWSSISSTTSQPSDLNVFAGTFGHKDKEKHTFEHSDWTYGQDNQSTLKWGIPEITPIPHMVQLESPRVHHALYTSYSSSYILDRTAFIGCAAHCRNSTPSQMINLGIGDSAALLDALHNAVSEGEDIGGQRMLSSYANYQNTYNFLIEAGTDLVNTLFKSQMKLSIVTRQAGKYLTDFLPFAKPLIAHILTGKAHKFG